MSEASRALAKMGRRPRRGEPDETRARITLAAARVFEEAGYFGTDSNAIARAAGYAPGTFYKHFEDKTDVFTAVYAWWVEHVWSGLGNAWSGGALSAAGARAAVDHVVRVHTAWKGFRRDLRYLASSEPKVRAAFTANRKKQLERLVAGARAANRSACFALLLEIERVADAIALGEAADMGVDAAELRAELASRIEALLAPSPA